MERMQPPPNYYGTPLGYANNPGFGGQQPPRPGMMSPQNGQMPPPGGGHPMPPQPPVQEEYQTFQPSVTHTNPTMFDVINANRGKAIKIYCTFSNSSKWHDVVLEGVCYNTGPDFITIKENDSSHYHLVSTKYINFIEFLEHPILP